MPRPLNIIDLAITEDVSNDAAEVARRLDQAADLIEDFTDQSAGTALEALLALAEVPDATSAAEVSRLAEEMNGQTEILHSEIERFLAVSAGQRPN
jgi:hypothetical protein